MKPVYGVINRHDRDRFEVHLVSLGGNPSASAGYREHDHDVIWQVGSYDDEKIARLLAAAGIDPAHVTHAAALAAAADAVERRVLGSRANPEALDR